MDHIHKKNRPAIHSLHTHTYILYISFHRKLIHILKHNPSSIIYATEHEHTSNKTLCWQYLWKESLLLWMEVEKAWKCVCSNKAWSSRRCMLYTMDTKTFSLVNLVFVYYNLHTKRHTHTQEDERDDIYIQIYISHLSLIILSSGLNHQLSLFKGVFHKFNKLMKALPLSPFSHNLQSLYIIINIIYHSSLVNEWYGILSK